MKNLLAGLAVILVTQSVAAEVAVIVHPSNTNTLDGGEISRIFLGKAKQYPDGQQAVPVTQTGAALDEFNDKVLNKSSSQLKAYWSKLVFTGKGTPPKEVNADADVVALVSANPSIIGFIDAAAVDGSVKVVATF